MIIVFDGECNFCNGWVRFVINRDPASVFRFCAAQSDVGARLMDAAGESKATPETLVLVDGDRIYLRSEAILRVTQELTGWRWAAGLLRLVPLALRDRTYAAFARRRYSLFGRNAECQRPDASVIDRFLA